MADADLMLVADAVVAELTAATTFSQPCAPTIAFAPRQKAEELQDVTVTVVPYDDVGQRLSRSQWQQDYKIGVLIQQAIDHKQEISQGRKLVRLAQEIADFYKANKHGPGNLAPLVDCNYRPLFDSAHIEKHGVYTTVINLTFRGTRP